MSVLVSIGYPKEGLESNTKYFCINGDIVWTDECGHTPSYLLVVEMYEWLSSPLDEVLCLVSSVTGLRRAVYDWVLSHVTP